MTDSPRLHRTIVRDLLIHLFVVSILSYLAFYLLDYTVRRYVTLFLDLRWVLFPGLLSGLLVVLFFRPSGDSAERPANRLIGWIPTIAVALVIGLYIWYRVRGLGWLAALVGALSAVAVVVFTAGFSSGERWSDEGEADEQR